MPDPLNQYGLAILQAIYDSEINISLSWCWDGGVDAKVFGFDGRWKYQKRCCSVEEAVRWIIETILEHDPESGFAKWWKSAKLSVMERTRP